MFLRARLRKRKRIRARSPREVRVLAMVTEETILRKLGDRWRRRFVLDRKAHGAASAPLSPGFPWAGRTVSNSRRLELQLQAPGVGTGSLPCLSHRAHKAACFAKASVKAPNIRSIPISSRASVHVARVFPPDVGGNQRHWVNGGGALCRACGSVDASLRLAWSVAGRSRSRLRVSFGAENKVAPIWRAFAALCWREPPTA
jgi:hypothetical protein